MSLYVLDTNFLITAHRDTYPLDIAVSFWNKVKDLAQLGKIISVDKVKNEIDRHDDALKHWCDDNLPHGFFHDTTNAINEYAQIAQWASSMNHHFHQPAIAEFLQASSADAWLVAFGLVNRLDRIIVTQEISQPARKNRIKIPEPCTHHGIRFVNSMEMFRQMGEQF